MFTAVGNFFSENQSYSVRRDAQVRVFAQSHQPVLHRAVCLKNARAHAHCHKLQYTCLSGFEWNREFRQTQQRSRSDNSPRCLGGVKREFQSRNIDRPRVLVCWTDKTQDGYSEDMTGVLMIALIVFALWTGSRVVGSLNNLRE
jgi:hypothetical protein